MLERGRIRSRIASKGCIYKQIKPPLVGEHAFPLTGFVCKEAHITFGGMMCCLTHVIPRPGLETGLLGGGSNVTVAA